MHISGPIVKKRQVEGLGCKKRMEQFDLLSLVHSSRTKHGIAHADYLRYSRHNTNKIRKTKSEIQSLVFKAERNWAFAMECKKNSLQFPRKRFHGIKKLNRAICHSKKIIEKTSGNERENLTCIAYSLGLEGLACVERKNWEEGVKALSNSRNIYVNLQKSAQSSRHEHYLQVAIDELDPLLKYCAYQLKIKTGMQVNIQDLLDMKRSIGNSGEDDGLEFQLNVRSCS
jgi:signal recognition particle subunit SRP68